MNDKLTVTLVTPEKLLLQKEIDELIAPGVLGEFGILPYHAPFLTALAMGICTFRKGNTYDYVVIKGGFLEVNNNKIIILAENSEIGNKIDLQKTLEEKTTIEHKLQDKNKLDDKSYKELEMDLAWQNLKINVAEKYK